MTGPADCQTDHRKAADLDLERRVGEFLAMQGRMTLRRLAVAADGGTVTIAGAVNSFYEKQLCLICAQRVAGVHRLVDLVRVG